MPTRWRFGFRFFIPYNRTFPEASKSQQTFNFAVLCLLSVECTNLNLISAQVEQPAPKMELDLYIPQA